MNCFILRFNRKARSSIAGSANYWTIISFRFNYSSNRVSPSGGVMVNRGWVHVVANIHRTSHRHTFSLAEEVCFFILICACNFSAGAHHSLPCFSSALFEGTRRRKKVVSLNDLYDH